MNKQELAATIWKSANEMRSKIDAKDYKDYILGFIFYKFLSDKELDGLKEDGWDEESLKEYLVETNDDLLETCKKRYGYFISYSNLFSTWLKKKTEFDASDVTTALSAFKRNINEKHKKIFENIFDTLDTGLSKLGDSAGDRTKAISKLIDLINPIPMDDKQGYDVLGYIYEYLISNFAANAGKKAGEFYTPHEVSLMMSQIVANHLKDRETIQIYDPTSGSGSLLINIGQSVSKYLRDKNKVKYYAQELKENTYSLTRMNLVMRGILPENIITRCGDTLADDWPYFDDKNKETTYETLYVDAVVSNPPYSQKWDPHEDARFDGYGIAPKSKADYAFLLHDLYHLNPDGIMTIVLPHGVLFRSGEEGQIRKNLIENDNIDTIIGLPANIFFGTGISTIVMVLKKKRATNDVLIIDASKGFVKDGRNNKLRECDIKKIVDTVINRVSIDKYSRVVSKDEIRNNDYNLNIPRYVNSSEQAESYDIYATMLGGIPNNEINELSKYWDAFPTLKNELFTSISTNFSELSVEDVKTTISNNKDIIFFDNQFKEKFSGFDSYLNELLIKGYDDINISKAEDIISSNIFERLSNIALIDKYQAYQLLADEWANISNDLEIIQTEGITSVNKVDPIMVIKKKDNKDEEAQEIQDGWKGHVLPFNLVQDELLSAEKAEIDSKNERLSTIISLYSEKIENLSEDDKQEINNDLNEEEDSFINKEVKKHAKELKKQKNVQLSIAEQTIIEVNELIEEEAKLNKEIKALTSNLTEKTKEAIETLPRKKALELLYVKWINPLTTKINELPKSIIDTLTKKVVALSNKYELTLVDIDNNIKNVESSFISMIDELSGSEDDLKGLSELKKLLGGENN